MTTTAGSSNPRAGIISPPKYPTATETFKSPSPLAPAPNAASSPGSLAAYHLRQFYPEALRPRAIASPTRHIVTPSEREVSVPDRGRRLSPYRELVRRDIEKLNSRSSSQGRKEMREAPNAEYEYRFDDRDVTVEAEVDDYSMIARSGAKGERPTTAQLVDSSAISMLSSRIDSLEETNRKLEDELRATRMRLNAALAKEADSSVTQSLSDSVINDLRQHLYASMMRLEVPTIVVDELFLRADSWLTFREDMFTLCRTVLDDHEAILKERAEVKKFDDLAMAAAINKSATVQRLREEVGSLELRLGAAEELAKQKSVLASKLKDENEQLAAQNRLNKVMFQTKESAVMADRARLEVELNKLKHEPRVACEGTASTPNRHNSSDAPSEH